MEYLSTRGSAERVSAAAAIARGLAGDGGLYVPDALPAVSAGELRELCALPYRERVERVIAPFLPEFTAEEVKALCAAAYGENFDTPETAPVHFTDERTGFLELWHGPTAAFKDMALQMLPRLLVSSLKKCGERRGVCILVATSGDTGKAALEGFADVEGTKILVFYPNGGVSDVQRLQMVSQRGANVGVCAVEGNFDDAQTGVKRIFSDRGFAKALDGRGWFLSSANSINWGRLLPQIAYYFSAYCEFVNAGKVQPGEKLDFCVPTGNFGNILAGWLAKRMGLPVGRLICASNANNVLTDFINTGVYDKRRTFHVTDSPSMDILVSSNLERLLYLLTEDAGKVAGWMAQLAAEGRYDVGAELRGRIAEDFSAGWCGDAETEGEIARIWREYAYLIDTHTAVASRVLAAARSAGEQDGPCCVVSTASAYKFCAAVLSALGERADAPGVDLIGRLEKLTGGAAPRPLAALAGCEERFTGCARPEDMRSVVEKFLS